MEGTLHSAYKKAFHLASVRFAIILRARVRCAITVVAGFCHLVMKMSAQTCDVRRIDEHF
jgi:hypothetical protein